MNTIEMYKLWCEYCTDCEWEGKEPLSYPAWCESINQGDTPYIDN